MKNTLKRSIVIWKDGTHNLVQGATWEYEADIDYLKTIVLVQDNGNGTSDLGGLVDLLDLNLDSI